MECWIFVKSLPILPGTEFVVKPADLIPTEGAFHRDEVTGSLDKWK